MDITCCARTVISQVMRVRGQGSQHVRVSIDLKRSVFANNGGRWHDRIPVSTSFISLAFQGIQIDASDFDVASTPVVDLELRSTFTDSVVLEPGLYPSVVLPCATMNGISGVTDSSAQTLVWCEPAAEKETYVVVCSPSPTQQDGPSWMGMLVQQKVFQFVNNT